MQIKTKYDWQNVPKYVGWIATDEDGNAWQFPDDCGEPHIGGEDGDVWVVDSECLLSQYNFYEYKGLWTDSLEKRPDQVEDFL